MINTVIGCRFENLDDTIMIAVRRVYGGIPTALALDGWESFLSSSEDIEWWYYEEVPDDAPFNKQEIEISVSIRDVE